MFLRLAVSAPHTASGGIPGSLIIHLFFMIKKFSVFLRTGASDHTAPGKNIVRKRLPVKIFLLMLFYKLLTSKFNADSCPAQTQYPYIPRLLPGNTRTEKAETHAIGAPSIALLCPG